MKKFAIKAARLASVIPAFALALSLMVTPVFAANENCSTDNLSISSGASCAQGNEQPANLFGDGGIFQTVTNILLFIVGAISVIMLIIGGIRYVVSGGDQSAVTSAKNTILYAIVGIVIAFLAFAAVQFVTNSLVSGTS